MKKTLVIMIASVSLIGIGLIILMVIILLNGGKLMVNSNLNLTDSRTIDMQDIESINITYSSDDLILYTGDSNELTIKEYRNFTPKRKTNVITDSNRIIVEGPRWDYSLAGIFGRRSRVEIYLPSDYSGDLEVAASSGDISSDAAFHLSSFRASCNSGDITFNEVNTETITLHASSGDISLKRGSGQLKATVNSGDITISSFSGSGSIRTSSGDSEVILKELTGDFDMIASSGDMDLKLPAEVKFKFEADASSGDIDTFFNDKLEFSNQKKHASGEVGDQAQFSIKMKVSSGDINVSQTN